MTDEVLAELAPYLLEARPPRPRRPPTEVYLHLAPDGSDQVWDVVDLQGQSEVLSRMHAYVRGDLVDSLCRRLCQSGRFGRADSCAPVCEHEDFDIRRRGCPHATAVFLRTHKEHSE